MHTPFRIRKSRSLLIRKHDVMGSSKECFFYMEKNLFIFVLLIISDRCSMLVHIDLLLCTESEMFILCGLNFSQTIAMKFTRDCPIVSFLVCTNSQEKHLRINMVPKIHRRNTPKRGSRSIFT